MESMVKSGNPYLGMLLLLVSMSLSWFVYVPIHELLHAAGCAATGGSVTVLEIQRLYGGALLAEVFPFVVPGGEYAGRLSGFDTHGSDLVYLATDALPFALSVFPGVFLLHLCTRRRRPFLFGLAAVLGFVGFKMLATLWVEHELSPWVSLGIICGLLGVSVVASLALRGREGPPAL